MAGATDDSYHLEEKIAPTATPSKRLGTANCATSVLDRGITPRPNPATEVTSTKSQIGVAALKRHMANSDNVTIG